MNISNLNVQYMVYLFSYIFIYSVLLFFLAPIIDKLFPILDKKKSNYKIKLEIILQIFIITLLFNIINQIMQNIFKSYSISLPLSGSSISAGLMFVGLQLNLIKKVNYISYENPFRFAY